jgi:hypothetical protein
MPALIRLYIIQNLIGFAIAALMVGLLLWLNIGNLWHLVTHSDMGLVAIFVLWLFNGIVFGAVQFAIAIMGMAEHRDDPRGPQPRLIPIRVAATAKSDPRRRG